MALGEGDPLLCGMRPTPWPALLVFIVCGLITESVSVSAQQAGTRGMAVTTAAGEQYRAGAMRRLVLGRHYRDLWTTPVEVQLLDLETFAGGLEPLRTGGGRQTKSLRFLGADGREYSFRSVDKDPSPVLDSLLRGTIVDDLVQDGISAAHPYGALVAAPLLDAAGVLHVDPQLRVMPDDPALGEFRQEFAGMLGFIEERPDENEGERAAFQGTARVIASERLTERLNQGPADRVDSRAFLRARIMDLFLGDWDRHRGQWRWATNDGGDQRFWLPVPTDRDQAFSKFDGLAPRLVSLYMPQFVRFEEDYPAIERLHWNARALDRWFLAGLERPVWDSIGSALAQVLEDDVIESAAGRLPSEIYALNSTELTTTLRSRRDELPTAWGSFYEVLAEKVDVQLTDVAEVVTVDRSTAGQVRVTVVAPSHSGTPFFDRRFNDTETREVRIHLAAGDDRVVFVGAEAGGIQMRVIGGPGNDTFDFQQGAGSVRIYDAEGQNAVTGDASVSVNTKTFDQWIWTEEDRDQPRDWGSRALPIFWSSFSSDLGLFIGGGARLEGYGFRKEPYASAFDLRGGYALFQKKGRLEIDGRINRENSPVFWNLGARVSRLDVLHYYGLGNQSTAGTESFHRVDQTAAEFGLDLGVSTGPDFTLTGGLVLKRLSTDDNAGLFFETLGSPYGSGQFVQLGASASLELDPLANSETTANRVRLLLHGSVFPSAFDVERTFGRAGAEGSALLSSGGGRISFALRAGAQQVWGRFPWSEAAFLGGSASIRGWAENRFAGDASAFGSAELRLRVLRPRVVVPVGIGVFGFTDAGRVALEGSSPGGWHTSYGGGLFFQPVQQPYFVRAGFGVSDDATQIFVLLGLPY